MLMKLIVLAGAKEGTVIPLKKKEFSIGRSKECTLRAGSEAISRRHCLIARSDSMWTVKDLGSRNGTLVNGERIEKETELHDGDMLSVGPLQFRVDASETAAPVEPAESSVVAKPPAPKNAAEAASRVPKNPDDSNIEEDISRWLLGSEPGEQALKETRTLTMGDTRAVGAQAKAAAAATPNISAEESPDAESETANEDAQAPEKAENGKKGWNLFGRGKGKKEPGKLPTRPDDQKSKDSREAATDILRGMTRRR
jgi:pSer/pThr/pTyr-binding forkhead associated (FHA) protein